MYFAFLDEFGHVGPFLSRSHPNHKTSPVFGIGGLLLPEQSVRPFATWFYQTKNALLANDLRRHQSHPATWEKKGSEVFNPKHLRKYSEIRHAGLRLLNQVRRRDGFIFFNGREKYLPPHQSKPLGLYTTVLGTCDPRDR
jgi:hypothetical protein